MKRWLQSLILLLAAGCSPKPVPEALQLPAPGPVVPVAAPPAAPVVLTLIGTNDLHGHMLADDKGRGGLALFAAYLKAVRAVHPVVLVDAGDEFQGTLESNLNEGASIIKIENALGYDAMAVGNHEFDYGPVGPNVVVRDPGDDAHGALKARGGEAHFPMLAANIYDAATHAPIAWPNFRPSTIFERGGVKVGVIGVATEETPASTMAENFLDLRLMPLAPAITAQAAALRAQGAQVIIVAAHAGANCDLKQDPPTCDDGEILKVARALAPHTVDVIVGGHTHAGVRNVVNGITIVEAFSFGMAFDRVDLTVDPVKGVIDAKAAIVGVCASVTPGTNRCLDADATEPAVYEGVAIKPDETIAALIAPYAEAARSHKAERLGVKIVTKITKVYDVESPLGNLFADLMRSARKADVAITNGGGLRTDLEAGDLTYGQVYEAYPFDNRFAILHLRGARLRDWIKGNLVRGKGILSISGVRARAACKDGDLQVELFHDEKWKKPVRDDEVLTVVTSDFLVAGGNDGAFGDIQESDRVIDQASLIREEIVAELKKRGGELRNEDKKLFDPSNRRLQYEGKRPLRCAR